MFKLRWFSVAAMAGSLMVVPVPSGAIPSSMVDKA
jgi:hypothetical protein